MPANKVKAKVFQLIEPLVMYLMACCTPAQDGLEHGTWRGGGAGRRALLYISFNLAPNAVPMLPTGPARTGDPPDDRTRLIPVSNQKTSSRR